MSEHTMPRPDWLLKYQARGFRFVFYATKEKGPQGADAKGWTTREYKVEDWQPGMNVGVMLGTEIAPGKFLCDVDFDWPEGISMSPALLPATGFGFGRNTKRVSHALYTTNQPVATKAYEDINGHVLVELRGTKQDGSLGHQTMVPPSIHPSGETVVLRLDDDIGHDDSVPRRVTLYAVACILLRHVGHRGLLHETRLALAGFLLTCGLTVEEAILVGETVAKAAGNNVDDVKPTVHTTDARMRAGDKVSGSGALAKAIGDDGKKVIARIREWLGQNEFITGKGDIIKADSQENIARAFEKLGVELTFDEFAQKPMIVCPTLDIRKPETLEDEQRNRVWLTIDEQFGFRPPAEFFDVVLFTLARDHRVHPVREYLDALTWDQTPRLDHWLITYGNAGVSDYTKAVGSIFMIASVRRVREPGCKFDELMVLESEQGKLKSSALRALCPNESWFSDDLPLDVDAKQIIERTGGKWIIEAAELSGMHPSKIEHLKAMLSRQVDGPVRMAYARLPKEQPRQFVIVGTTNSHAYLNDSTGNRRFWPVRVDVFDISSLRRDRDQLWAEAAAREATGESIRLPEHLYPIAAKQQERRRSEDPWEQIITTKFAAPYQRIKPDEVWEELGIPKERRDQRGHKRIIEIMQRLGFKKTNVRVDAKTVVKGWGRGDVPPQPHDAGGKFLPHTDGDGCDDDGQAEPSTRVDDDEM